MVAYIWFINIANYEDWYPVEDIIYSSPLKALCAGFKYGKDSKYYKGYSLTQIGVEKIIPWLDNKGKIEGWEILDVVKHAEPWYLDEEED